MDVVEKTVTGMAEYIEREAAQTSCRKYSFAESYDAFAVDCILKAIPAADVAPVRHGEWEIVVGSNGNEYMVCTCCRVSQDLTGVFTYCPNCGCRMDGGRDQ